MDLINQTLNEPTLDKTTAIKCEKCGCETFIPSFMLRKISKILIGSTDDGIVPVKVFSCVKCGHINKEFMPKELSDEISK